MEQIKEEHNSSGKSKRMRHATGNLAWTFLICQAVRGGLSNIVAVAVAVAGFYIPIF